MSRDTAPRWSLPVSPRGRRLVAAVCAAGAFVIAALVAGLVRIELGIAWAGAPPPPDSFVLPAPEAARMLAAGYTEAAADVVWTRMLVYYGERTARRRDPQYLHAYAEALVTLDPQFRAPYVWAGFAVPFASPTGVPRPVDVEYAVRLMRLGLARFPDDAELYGSLGYDLYYELPRWISDPQAVLRAKVEGAECLRRQAALGGGPPWLALAAATAFEQLNLDDLAARHLEGAVYGVGDDDLRARILERLALLRAHADVEQVRRAALTLTGVAAERMPYLPEMMFLLLSSAGAQARMAEGLVPGPFVED